MIGGTTSRIYGGFIVNDLGSPSGEGFDFINGPFERFYAVFGTTNKGVGFDATDFTISATTYQPSTKDLIVCKLFKQ